LNSVDEAIIFLDMDLKIRRYTPQMGQIMILLTGDVGRSISDIAMNIRYEDLMIDIRSVLDSLNTREKEVQTKEGRWFKLKILPYRTVENVIDGVVVDVGSSMGLASTPQDGDGFDQLLQQIEQPGTGADQ